MDEEKIVRIKAAVKGNFEESPDRYHAFETEHGFFRRLNQRLLGRMELSAGAWILDVGCGTGASTFHLLESVMDSRVWGLDISPAMLERARALAPQGDRVHFVEGDAASLTDYFDFPFDAIIYSASIFLIPDYKESLRQARRLLKPGGAVGLTFMNGLYDPDGDNLMAAAEAKAKEGVSFKRAVLPDEFQAFFVGVFPHTRIRVEDMSLSEDILRRFFSIPAMSAGLFPGIDYSERVRKVNRVFDQLSGTDILFRWTVMIGSL